MIWILKEIILFWFTVAQNMIWILKEIILFWFTVAQNMIWILKEIILFWFTVAQNMIWILKEIIIWIISLIHGKLLNFAGQHFGQKHVNFILGHVFKIWANQIQTNGLQSGNLFLGSKVFCACDKFSEVLKKRRLCEMIQAECMQERPQFGRETTSSKPHLSCRHCEDMNVLLAVFHELLLLFFHLVEVSRILQLEDGELKISLQVQLLVSDF